MTRWPAYAPSEHSSEWLGLEGACLWCCKNGRVPYDQIADEQNDDNGGKGGCLAAFPLAKIACETICYYDNDGG